MSSGTKTSPIPAAIEAPECLSTVPTPRAIRQYAVRSSAVPATARAAAGSVIDTGGYAGSTYPRS
jgi:hypothetical protein